MKISVIGHTNNLESVDHLPPRSRLAFAESDLVLHVGNVGSLALLQAIQDQSGLTFAIYGDKDPEEVKRYLDADKVVEFASRRIGMIFQVGKVEQSLRAVLMRTPPSAALIAERLVDKFDSVDCVVFGSPSSPFNYVHKGILVFNPGPIVDAKGVPGTMGILEITDRVITGRLVSL